MVSLSSAKTPILIKFTAALIALAFLAGCGPKGYEQPITKFHDASATVIESAKVYFSELNKVERDSYILAQTSTRSRIDLPRVSQVQVFSSQGLQARFEALNVLEDYGTLLLKLVQSDSPDKVRTETVGLEGSLTALSGTFSSLTHADDQAFRSRVGPVLNIVGEVLRLVVRNRIKEALDRAITRGEAPINDLLRALRRDINDAYQRKRTAMSGIRKYLVDQYNLEVKKGATADPEKLRIYADRIRTQEDRWEIFNHSNPGEGLAAMAKAHTALVEYAESDKKSANFQELVAAMEDFAASARRIGEAVQALRGK
jgi:hypothetical protein